MVQANRSDIPPAPWIQVEDYRLPLGWVGREQIAARARAYCELLEKGQILFFRELPFHFPIEDQDFLLAQPWTELRLHKNVSYRPSEDLLRGVSGNARTIERLHTIMRNYSAQVIEFLTRFLPAYAGKWILDFSSFRPIEEEGRDLPIHKRNDLLHVDAFPSRPTHGGRILRVFTNLNPKRPRVWETTDKFPMLVKTFADDAGLPSFARESGSAGEKIRKTFAPVFKAVGVKGMDRSAYDRF